VLWYLDIQSRGLHYTRGEGLSYLSARFLRKLVCQPGFEGGIYPVWQPIITPYDSYPRVKSGVSITAEGKSWLAKCYPSQPTITLSNHHWSDTCLPLFYSSYAWLVLICGFNTFRTIICKCNLSLLFHCLSASICLSCIRGVASSDWGCMGIYPPKISPSELFTGKNDVCAADCNSQ